jgi:hypothetical protein
MSFLHKEDERFFLFKNNYNINNKNNLNIDNNNNNSFLQRIHFIPEDYISIFNPLVLAIPRGSDIWSTTTTKITAPPTKSPTLITTTTESNSTIEIFYFMILFLFIIIYNFSNCSKSKSLNEIWRLK